MLSPAFGVELPSDSHRCTYTETQPTLLPDLLEEMQRGTGGEAVYGIKTRLVHRICVTKSGLCFFFLITSVVQARPTEDRHCRESQNIC